MNNLVVRRNRQATTTSLIVAEYFGKNHQHIMRDIRKLEEQIDMSKFGQMFLKRKYKDTYKREQEMYIMNRDGFMLVVMRMSGKKALEKQMEFIEAFNKMEQYIMNQQNEQWKTIRDSGKATRKLETKSINKFVIYAKENGSTNANRYFLNLSKLVNKLLGIPKDSRDSLTMKQLHTLDELEDIITHIIDSEIEKGTYYKDIYKMCRDKCTAFMQYIYLVKNDEEHEVKTII